jgi:hypothetical protein
MRARRSSRYGIAGCATKLVRQHWQAKAESASGQPEYITDARLELRLPTECRLQAVVMTEKSHVVGRDELCVCVGVRVC